MKNNIEIKFKSEDRVLDPEFSFPTISSLIKFLTNLKKGEYYIEQSVVDCPLTDEVVDMEEAVKAIEEEEILDSIMALDEDEVTNER